MATKGGFFSESAMCLSNLQISKNIYSKKTIMNLKFKFQAQDSFLEYFFWRFKKTNRTFWKKATFSMKKYLEKNNPQFYTF